MPEQRIDSIGRLRENGAFDVIVVGGGINGIGVYRELALQGLRVLLVERNDFCSGCSAAPSRMIHGGLRYLENGEVGLVQESLRERDALLANAPHMVRPLPTTIPIRSIFSGLLNGAMNFLGLTEAPSRRGALAIKTGLAMYGWMTRTSGSLPRHEFRGRRRTFARWPGLDPELRFSATYYDAWISYPERLGVELVRDTARLAPDNVALNYAEISNCKDGFILRDIAGGGQFPVTARAIVNATGAWLDDAAAQIQGFAGSTDRLVEGTKGSHLILDHKRLYDALDGHMIYFENVDGRVCIVFPYLGKVLAGSTDIRVQRAEKVACEPDELNYILGSLRLVFPGIDVKPSHVAYSYSGIRPLPRSNHAFTGRISRGHFIHRIDGPTTQFCMVGGKWTTFRAFAEQAADEVLAFLDRPRLRHTQTLAIGGGADFVGADDGARTLVLSERISGARAAHLVDLYGSHAPVVHAFCSARGDDRPLDGATEITEAEIVYLTQHELVFSLADVILRRTPLAIRGDISLGVVEKIAAILARELGWDTARQQAETADMIAELEKYHGVSRETLDRRTMDRSMACA